MEKKKIKQKNYLIDVYLVIHSINQCQLIGTSSRVSSASHAATARSKVAPGRHGCIISGSKSSRTYKNVGSAKQSAQRRAKLCDEFTRQAQPRPRPIIIPPPAEFFSTSSRMTFRKQASKQPRVTSRPFEITTPTSHMQITLLLLSVCISSRKKRGWPYN